MKRTDGRAHNQFRPINVTYNVFEYAAGSVLYEIGKTKVLCAVSIQEGVPPFLRGKKTGWLTAEYSLLPTATPTRTVREATTGKRNGRGIEISRLIGRALRTVVNLDLIGEHTIFIDCDVQQADGGTRTACITGASLALKAACDRWVKEGFIAESILRDDIAALSVGIMNSRALLDVDFMEDSAMESDFNFVMTRSGMVIEVQGSAERSPLSWEQFESVRSLATHGIEQLFTQLDDIAQQPSPGFPLFERLVAQRTLET